MLGFSTYAALLPELRDAWSLSNSQAGIVGGMFFAGYVATVSLFTALTDRMDARWVYFGGGVLAAAASAGFGLAASGFLSAALFQVLLGAGIAATYMPGLRLLSDRISGPYQSRYIAFYTSFFGIGTALSFAIAGFVTPLCGWRAAFLLSAAGPLAAGAAVFFLIGARRPESRQAVLARRALPRARLAQGARRSRQRRLHLRLCGALPGALRLACVDGGVSRLLGEPAPGRQLSLACGRDRRGGQPDCGAGLDRRQRGRAARGAAALDRVRDDAHRG